MKQPNPSKELLKACKLLQIRREKGFIFNFKGHEVDLSGCVGDKPMHVIFCIANILAERLTDIYNGNVEALFGETNEKTGHF